MQHNSHNLFNLNIHYIPKLSLQDPHFVPSLGHQNNCAPINLKGLPQWAAQLLYQILHHPSILKVIPLYKSIIKFSALLFSLMALQRDQIKQLDDAPSQ